MENRNELFKAIPIFDSGLKDEEIRLFSVGHKEGQGLVDYLYGYAEAEEGNNLMRTYIVRDVKTDEFVGYFSLKAGMISINESKVNNVDTFDTMPGIELANFAINSNYIAEHNSMKECGKIIFNELIIPIIKEVSTKVGVRLIYIFALPLESLIERYKEYRFKRLTSEQEEQLHKRLKPQYDEGCIFMFQEL
ncbi:MAG: hypothetical protein IJI46_04320 [Erysipelotrichaceae bacterium]|nr:hypothetical protein [Erysipelotrichaceae bacterium]